MNSTIKFFILITAVSCSGNALMAQFTGRSVQSLADNFYKKGDYYSAALYYERSLTEKKGKNAAGPYIQPADPAEQANQAKRSEVLYKLAESYRLVNDYEHAESWYKTLLDEDPMYNMLARLYYGVCLRSKGKYEEAAKAFTHFLDRYRTIDSYQAQGKRESDNCAFILQQSKVKPVAMVEKLPASVNPEGANYAAGWLSDEILLFTSTRSDSTASSKKTYTNALYSVRHEGSQFTGEQKLDIPDADKMEQGVGAVTPDGATLYLTRWSVDKQGKKTSAIYVSAKQDKGWGQPVKLGEEVNADGYNARQPHVTADGKFLFFASDKPGSKGGFDIWSAPLKKGEPGRAVNAGAVVNTKENEESPFYHVATGTLVFASNGRTGMGGYDLYTATGRPGTAAWAQPENMGAPVNSVKDDIYFVTKGTTLLDAALLSSDRSSRCCLELFTVTAVSSQPPVAKEDTPAGTGVAVTPSPVIAVAPPVLDSTRLFEGTTKLVTRDVLFAFDKADPDTASYPYLNKVADWLKANPDTRISLGAHTDGKGSEEYNLKLSEARAAACAAYLEKAGIARDRVQAVGFGKCCPLEKETMPDGSDNPAARDMNRRVEIKLITKTK